MNKKFEALKHAYENARYDSVFRAYGRPSDAKINAESWCIHKMKNMNGWDYRILSYNTFNFTCGWLVENPETGVLQLCVETARNSYRFDY